MVLIEIIYLTIWLYGETQEYSLGELSWASISITSKNLCLHMQDVICTNKVAHEIF